MYAASYRGSARPDRGTPLRRHRKALLNIAQVNDVLDGIPSACGICIAGVQYDHPHDCSAVVVTGGKCSGMPDSMSVRPTTEYVSATRSVVDAGEGLVDALGEDRQTVRFMAERLERRLIELGTGATALRDQAFEDLDAAPDKPVIEPALEDALASVIVDVQASRLAVAAGRVVGEVGAPQGHDEYSAALTDLRETANKLSRSPSSLAFEATVTPSTMSSRDETTARATFHTQAGAALEAITGETASVVTLVVEQIKQLPVVAQLSDLVDKARDWKGQQPPAVGRLIRLGLTKLKHAVEALERLFKRPELDELGHELASSWEGLTADGLLTRVLRQAISIEAAERQVDATRAIAALEPARLDAASRALAALTERYRATVRLIGRILRAFTLLAATVALVALAVAGLDPYLTAISAAVYVVVIGGVVLTARDYADSGHGLGRVRGVASIAGELASR
jgi:hypothetical protein